MAEYTRLSSAPLDDDEAETKSKPTQEISPHYVLLFSVLMALIAISAAAAFHLNVLSATWNERQALLKPKYIEHIFRMVQPTPNLDKGHATMRKMKFKFPRMVFPMFIVRANAAAPDTVYQSGPSVVLSPSDSMIYHWRTNSSWPKCYLAGWVSASKDLIAGHKSYTSEGDITAIEMWNFLSALHPTQSWNTRPERLSLLGTVNFISRETQARLGYLDAQEIKAPTPRFNCLGDTEITVEVVCKGCRLQFNQMFSMPPL
ncbi:hypothetical protein C8F04DRAFT_1310231, partial [Mycena alexandri]